MCCDLSYQFCSWHETIVCNLLGFFPSKIRPHLFASGLWWLSHQTDALYMHKIEGLVETNKGIGKFTVKECDEHGHIAQTLYQLALNKERDASKLQKLNVF